MKKYLISILNCGEDFSERKIVNGLNDGDIIRKVFIYMNGYEDKEEYEEYKGEGSYNELDLEECIDYFDSCENILEFIYDNNFNLIYSRY